MKLLTYSDTAGVAHPPTKRHPLYGPLLIVTMFVLKIKNKETLTLTVMSINSVTRPAAGPIGHNKFPSIRTGVKWPS